MMNWTSILATALLSLGQVPQAQEGLNSIYGIRIGTSFEEAKKILDPLGESGGVTTRDGGRRHAWTLRDGDLKSVALRAAKDGKVKWVTGFFRPGQEKPFSSIGDLKQAQHTPHEAIWSVKDPSGPYRIVAKGADGKASVVYFLKL
jgi:hypothetical protein